MPKTNRDYWQTKIQRNMNRDVRTQAQLTELGWHVRAIWECQLGVGVDELVKNLAASSLSLSQAEGL